MKLREYCGVQKIEEGKYPFPLEPTVLVEDCYVGIEIEIEGVHDIAGTVNSLLWSIKKDGSLRDGGIELVSTRPHRAAAIERSLIGFDYFIKKQSFYETSPELSERCSVHIHIDVTELRPEQARSVILFFKMFERVLFLISGNRNNNIFCWPHYKDHRSQLYLYKILTSNVTFETIFSDPFEKYSAINLKPMTNFGSIEIRMHEGTLDYKKILQFVKTLQLIRKFALNNVEGIKTLPEFISLIGFDKPLSECGIPITDKIREAFILGVRDIQKCLNLREIQNSSIVLGDY